jgi:hypothetical protein
VLTKNEIQYRCSRVSCENSIFATLDHILIYFLLILFHNDSQTNLYKYYIFWLTNIANLLCPQDVKYFKCFKKVFSVSQLKGHMVQYYEAWLNGTIDIVRLIISVYFPMTVFLFHNLFIFCSLAFTKNTDFYFEKNRQILLCSVKF